MSDKAPTILGFTWERPTETDRYGLDISDDAWIASSGDQLLIWEPETETLVEFGVDAEGNPTQTNWSGERIV